MKNTVIILCVFILQNLFIVTSSADQFRILQQDTGAPLSHVQVKILENQSTFYTDSYGRVSINIAPGPYTLEIISQNSTVRENVTIDNTNHMKELKIISR